MILTIRISRLLVIAALIK